MIFISKLNFVSQPKKIRVSTKEIVIKFFIDIDEQTAGWYALGHYEREDFLANFVRLYPNIKLPCKKVELAWGRLEGKGFLELTNKPNNDSQPITLVEDLGEYYYYRQYC